MAEALSKRFGAGNFRVLAQDPIYSTSRNAPVARHGIKAIGDHGAAGFGDIVKQTIMFSFYPEINVRELFADIMKLAAIVITRLWETKQRDHKLGLKSGYERTNTATE
ncbi:uncharacterized protein BCR38DRAFT_404164 [Pseudomassariella vexata]|uniref:Uncharacterized protein n=1 Tax=Pseudomassariella vexata TaxID=1141098 RepID=A0A1Y2EHJ3_9PEZI|nr:uncharacterized protein BCR38DRAFT_404164 [Pseudomassariella vexata]ORY71038.1 hypothetical protein BCR38DRAFT_404164 [Pseudomassariella vexata]